MDSAAPLGQFAPMSLPASSVLVPPGLAAMVRPLVGAHPWHPLSGGRSNRLWQVGGSVVKLYRLDRASPLFANDPMQEAYALCMLCAYNVTPEFRAFLTTPWGPVLVYRHVPGQVLRSPNAALAQTLRRLHAVPDLRLPRYSSAPQDLLAQGDKMAAEHVFYKQLQPLRPAPIPAIAAPLVTLHRDAVARNALCHNRHVTLIDWQCPGMGDAAEDLATALSPAMQVLYGDGPLSALEINDFLRAYGCSETVDRYHKLAPFFHYRMAGYCLWRMGRGDADYAAAFTAELAALAT
jgi:thiamine kinase